MTTAMLERVTYADLHFAGGLLQQSPGEEPDEGELTYENLQGRPEERGGPPGAGQGAEGRSPRQEPPRGAEEPAAAQGPKPRKKPPAAGKRSALLSGHPGSAGWGPWSRCAALGALGVGLLLLSVIIALGVQYSQASWQLQRASRDHAESQRLLHQAEEELNATTEALRQSRAAENRTRLLLGHANRTLADLREEKAGLDASLRRATSCRQRGCCPQGWTLFRWKCLRISDTWKSWEDSREDCKGKSSQLLVLRKPWDAPDVWPPGSLERLNRYWIGLQKSWGGSFNWVDGTSAADAKVSEPGYYGYCGVLHQGALSSRSCEGREKSICEQPASALP